MKILFYILAILFGVFMFVYGGYDDSPGGQFLGVITFIFGIVNLIKSKKRPERLIGKVIIVTGASAGIGERTALELAKHNVKIVITARHKKRLNDTVKEITSLGSECLAVHTDLTDAHQITNLVKTTIKKFGRVDILINIAGWGIHKWFEDYKFDEIENQFQVNVLGMAELTRQIIPFMKKQRSGHIINMSSYSSRIVFPPLTIYSSTKYAVEGITDGLRRELSPWGIKVSRVHPSAVSGTQFNKQSEKRGGVKYKALPIGRVTKQYVAEKLVSLIYNPRPSLFLGRLYDVPALVNRYFPWLVDIAAYWWVKRHRKISA